MSAGKAVERALAAAEPVRHARETLGAPEGVWVVGGALRDALLGAEIRDVDLAVTDDAAGLARRLAHACGGHRFQLSDEHETWRVGPPSRDWTIDVVVVRGGAIEQDLRLRDFTVNALALPLAGGALLDPLAGEADAADRVLRVCSEAAFADDPLRLMRAARLGAAFALEPSPETIDLGRRWAPRAGEPAGERRLGELRGMIAGPDPLRALALLDRLELTEVVLPPLAALRGVDQSANHHLDVHEHTIEVLRRWLAVEADLGEYVGDAASEVESALAEPLADGFNRRDAIRLAAVLHDIGKPATRTVRDGFVGFRGHDAVGAEMIVELCAELRTSRRLAEHLAAIARHHLVLGFMTHERPLSRRRIWEYIRLTSPVALDVTLLTVADRLSAQGSGVPAEAIEAHLRLAREMVDEILALEREGPPAPLLGGDEIAAELDLEGERIGAAVRELAAAQFAGEVDDRDAARAHLRQWADR